MLGKSCFNWLCNFDGHKLSTCNWELGRPSWADWYRYKDTQEKMLSVYWVVM